VLDTIAHGALMVGGSFADLPDFDPTVSRVVTEELYYEVEPAYPMGVWYPAHLGTVNRFLAIDGQSRERLVVVPGQFWATSDVTPTVGVERLYSDLAFEVYHAPITATDFIAPSIWQAEAISTSLFLRFRVRVEDDSGSVVRTVVLYREEGDPYWSKAELAYDAAAGLAEGFVPPVDSPIYYFVQAVDPTGNVALVLDHESPWKGPVDGDLWDPSLPRDVWVAQAASALTVDEGGVVTYTVVVRNTGLGMLTSTTISSPLPAGLALSGTVAIEPPGTVGTVLFPPGLVQGLTVVPGESLTLTYQAQALDGPALITTTVVVTSAEISAPVLATATITVRNVPPTAMDDAYEVDAGTTLTVTAPGVLTNDDDVPADEAKWTVTLADGPAHGTLSLAASGAFTYAPTGDFSGTDVFTYTVADGDGGDDVATVTITIRAVEVYHYTYLPLVSRDSSSVLDSGVDRRSSSKGSPWWIVERRWSALGPD
jgi:uncharacterized repeat protein (TIGR01451 family)